MADIRVTVWNEYRHEKKDPKIAAVYPQGIHGAIAAHLRTQPGLVVRTATLDEPEHGLTPSVLAETDVLTWWGHMAHRDVADEVVDRVQQRVLDGMGLIVFIRMQMISSRWELSKPEFAAARPPRICYTARG